MRCWNGCKARGASLVRGLVEGQLQRVTLMFCTGLGTGLGSGLGGVLGGTPTSSSSLAWGVSAAIPTSWFDREPDTPLSKSSCSMW